jgi:hypothetical protein
MISSRGRENVDRKAGLFYTPNRKAASQIEAALSFRWRKIS